MTIRLCVLLWELPGRAEALHDYEDDVLALLPEHGARLISRDTVVERTAADPLEIQVIELPDRTALASYMADPRRTAMSARRDAAVARTDVLRLATE